MITCTHAFYSNFIRENIENYKINSNGGPHGER